MGSASRARAFLAASFHAAFFLPRAASSRVDCCSFSLCNPSCAACNRSSRAAVALSSARHAASACAAAWRSCAVALPCWAVSSLTRRAAAASACSGRYKES